LVYSDSEFPHIEHRIDDPILDHVAEGSNALAEVLQRGL